MSHSPPKVQSEENKKESENKKIEKKRIARDGNENKKRDQSLEEKKVEMRNPKEKERIVSTKEVEVKIEIRDPKMIRRIVTDKSKKIKVETDQEINRNKRPRINKETVREEEIKKKRDRKTRSVLNLRKSQDNDLMILNRIF